jgi:alanyl-tRNA synthetase
MELEAQIERMLSQLKDSKKQLAEASSRLMEYDAARVWEEAAETDGLKVISFNAGPGSMDAAKQYAIRLVSHPRTAAAVGASGADNAYLVVARSQDLPSADASAAFKSVITLLGGKGGGNPAMAQGGGPGVAALDEALEAAREALLTQLRK